MKLKDRVKELESELDWSLVFIGGHMGRTPEQCIVAMAEEIERLRRGNDRLNDKLNQFIKVAGYEYFSEPPKSGFRKIKKGK